MSQARSNASEGPGRGPEAEVGGADAVEKTTYVIGEGTEPEARPARPDAARGATFTGSAGAWVVVAIAALIALVYVMGIFR
jgi:hypothetical protein